MARLAALLLCAASLLAGCASSAASETGMSADHLESADVADANLKRGLVVLGEKTKSVEIEVTPVSWVYAGGQMIKRSGAPVGSLVTSPATIAGIFATLSTPPAPFDCGARYPTSETQFVFHDEAGATAGYLFVDSSHCRDNVGVPVESIGPSLMNLSVMVDLPKLEALLAPPRVPAAAPAPPPPPPVLTKG